MAPQTFSVGHMVGRMKTSRIWLGTHDFLVDLEAPDLGHMAGHMAAARANLGHMAGHLTQHWDT